MNQSKKVSSFAAPILELEPKNGEQQHHPKLELKQLPGHLEYVFLEEDGGQPVILSSTLTSEEETKLVKVLKANKGAMVHPIVCIKFRWTMSTNLWLNSKDTLTPL